MAGTAGVHGVTSVSNENCRHAVRFANPLASESHGQQSTLLYAPGEANHDRRKWGMMHRASSMLACSASFRHLRSRYPVIYCVQRMIMQDSIHCAMPGPRDIPLSHQLYQSFLSSSYILGALPTSHAYLTKSTTIMSQSNRYSEYQQALRQVETLSLR